MGTNVIEKSKVKNSSWGWFSTVISCENNGVIRNPALKGAAISCKVDFEMINFWDFQLS